MRPSARRRASLLLVATLTLAHGAARGQDFASPLSRISGAPLEMLERGLSSAGASQVETAWTGRYGMPELSTQAAALAAAAGPWTVAAGLSQTGDRDIGWHALGAAIGFARDRGGSAVRGVVRRDREGFASVLGVGVGVEVGGGAWLRAGDDVTLWASAPQLWTRGTPPPLHRALELGAVWAAHGFEVWLARESPAHPQRSDGDNDAGVAATSGPWRIWIQARNHPLRGGLGVAAAVRRLRLAVLIESHPVLGETVKLSLGLTGGGKP